MSQWVYTKIRIGYSVLAEKAFNFSYMCLNHAKTILEKIMHLMVLNLLLMVVISINLYTLKGGICMPCLDCMEKDCAHNQSGYCCLSSIQVKEEGAAGYEAICGSYSHASGAMNRISNEAASPETDVDCEERQCCHNENCHCKSSHIHIGECACGPECETFEIR